MNSFRFGIDSYRSGMNSFHIKLSKVTILPFSFLLQLPLRNWKLCFLILSLHKKFYFLTLFTTPNSSIYPEWFHSGSEWIHSVLEWIHTVPEYIHSGLTFLIVLHHVCMRVVPSAKQPMMKPLFKTNIISIDDIKIKCSVNISFIKLTVHWRIIKDHPSNI